MMTMLVIFLLMSFSATGEILFVQKNIVLPDAQNWTDLERAPVIGVSKDVVTLDGSQVATADDLMKDSSTGDFKIAELHDKLVTLKNNYKLLHPGEEFNGIAIIQSDKNVEFKMLKKIMYSVAVAGYQNVNFAVTPKAKGGGAPAARKPGPPSEPTDGRLCGAGQKAGRLFYYPFHCSGRISHAHPVARPRRGFRHARRRLACQGDPNDPMTWAKQLKNLRTQKEALDHLANMDVEKARPAVPALIELYKDTKRPEHLEALARYKDERTKPLFIEALDYTDDDFDRATIAAGVLGEMKAPDAVDPLIKAAEKPLPIKSRANNARIARHARAGQDRRQARRADADEDPDHVGRRPGLPAQPEGGAGAGRVPRPAVDPGPHQGPVHDRAGAPASSRSAAWRWCASARPPSTRWSSCCRRRTPRSRRWPRS